MNRLVYADHSATTAVRPEVLEAMLPFLKEQYGNPSSLYQIAQESKIALEKARAQLARAIGAKEREIFLRVRVPKPTTGPLKAWQKRCSIGDAILLPLR